MDSEVSAKQRFEIALFDSTAMTMMANRRKGDMVRPGAKANRQLKDAGSLSPTKARALVQRVAESQGFHRATALRKFLFFVVERAISGRIEELKEQSIGVQALGRDPDYDPRLDNIVRVRAGELRRRLALYFASEGRREPIVLTIPPGSYCPAFTWRRRLSFDAESNSQPGARLKRQGAR